MFFQVHTKKSLFSLCFLAFAFFAYLVMQCISYGNHATAPAFVHFPFFWLVFGCGACILIVCISNWFAQLGLTKEENHDVQ